MHWYFIGVLIAAQAFHVHRCPAILGKAFTGMCEVNGVPCKSLLDLPLLPTRNTLGIPLLRRSDIANLASASAALKQLGLTSPSLAGAFVAISGASDAGKVSIRMLAEDGTGALPDRLTATSLRVPIANY